ncbi:MAG: TIGR03936 family radical SAM-associated protein [Coriobacteriales bacterium]
MADERFRLWIRYTKEGRLAYLSHLEVARCLERCIRRAGLPFMVSQGFSPHMRTSFGWALPVGVSSQDEYVEVMLYEYVPPQKVIESFDGVLPMGMRILDAWYVSSKSKSLVDEFPYSIYECKFSCVDAGVSPKELAKRVDEALSKLLEQGQLTVHRKKKDKVVKFEGLLCYRPVLVIGDDSRVEMTMTTFTEGKGALRPDLFCAELLKFDAGIVLNSICRVQQRRG